MEEHTNMANFIPDTIENYKENSCQSINIDNIKETQYQFTDNVNIKCNFNERSLLYKKPIKKGNYRIQVDFDETSQEIRRQELLKRQKNSRNKCLNDKRGILEEILNFEDEEMEVQQSQKKRYKVNKKYKEMLMLSEWMLEVPQDFAENWIMVPCPIGKRVIIVAYRGSTKIYTRRGIELCQCNTALPGGNKTSYKNSTILDAVFLKDKNTYYVLDILSWSTQSMIDCEVQFRFFWLKSHLDRIEELKEVISDINDYKILLLPTVTCDNNFYECLESISNSLALDGLLFYHKESFYVSGRSPLVTWLKPYMLPEVLGMHVPEPLDEKPSSYIDFEHHVHKVMKMEKLRKDNFEKRKKEWKTKSQEEME